MRGRAQVILAPCLNSERQTRDDDLVGKIADLTGLTERTVRKRPDEAHGRTLARNLFDDRWPAEAEDFEGKSAAWARNAELFEELANLTGLTERVVRKRLQEAHGSRRPSSSRRMTAATR